MRESRRYQRSRSLRGTHSPSLVEPSDRLHFDHPAAEDLAMAFDGAPMLESARQSCNGLQPNNRSRRRCCSGRGPLTKIGGAGSRRPVCPRRPQNCRRFKNQLGAPFVPGPATRGPGRRSAAPALQAHRRLILPVAHPRHGQVFGPIPKRPPARAPGSHPPPTRRPRPPRAGAAPCRCARPSTREPGTPYGPSLPPRHRRRRDLPPRQR